MVFGWVVRGSDGGCLSAVMVRGLGYSNIGKGGLSTLVPPCRRHFRYALRTNDKVERRRRQRR
jgi:hypothetical protein